MATNIHHTNQSVHILNGDALLQQFPASIKGDKIIARECLIVGDVSGDSMDDFFASRSDYLLQAYGAEPADYHHKVITEFDKIKRIPATSQVYLWFEDDLFCQVNLWFVAHFLLRFTKVTTASLIRPTTDMRYGFGGMKEKELVVAYQNKTQLNGEDLEVLNQLWFSYQNNDLVSLHQLANKHQSKFPFLIATVQAHIDRFPINGMPGRPKQTLQAIISELNTHEFGPVFTEFSRRESIYGFGDLQVKSLLDELMNNT